MCGILTELENLLATVIGKSDQGFLDGRFLQIRDRDLNPTGPRSDKGGHKGQSDPRAKGRTHADRA